MNIGSMIRGLLGDTRAGEAKSVELKEGQVVRGVVLSVSDSGKEAVVQIQGTPVRAELETPLAAGQTLNLQVGAPGEGGLPVLKPVSPGEAALATPQSMGEAIEALGLAGSKAGREIIQAMQAGGLAFTKETAAQLDAAMNAKPPGVPASEWLEAAVVSLKRGLPVTAETVKGLQQAIFGPKLHQLLVALETELNVWAQQSSGGAGTGEAAGAGRAAAGAPGAAFQAGETPVPGNTAGNAAGASGSGAAPPSGGAGLAAGAQEGGLAGALRKGEGAAAVVREGAAAAAGLREGAGNAAVPREGAGSAAGLREGAGIAAAGTPGVEGTAAGLREGTSAGAGLREGVGNAPAGSRGSESASAGTLGGTGTAAGTQEGAGTAAGLREGAGVAAGMRDGVSAEAGAREGAGAAAGVRGDAGAAGVRDSAGAAAGLREGAGMAGTAAGVREDAAAGARDAAGIAAGVRDSAGTALLAKLQGVLAELRGALPQLSDAPPASGAAGGTGAPPAPAGQDPVPAAPRGDTAAPQGNAPWVGQLLKLLGAEHEQLAVRGGVPQAAHAASGGAEEAAGTLKGVLLQVLGSSEAPPAVKEAAGQLVQQLTGQQLLLNTDRTAPFAQVTMFLPLQGPDGRETASVHIQSRRGCKGELDAANCRLWFDLDMKLLGHTLVDVQVMDRIVSLKLHNNEPWVQELLEGRRGQISTAVEAIGYQLSGLRAGPLPELSAAASEAKASDYVPNEYKGVDYRI